MLSMAEGGLETFITAEDLAKRPLHRGLAVDPPKRAEIDDAISVARLDGPSDYLVRVHVADAGLLYGTPHVDYARAVGWSTYEGAEPALMLPRDIALGALSLGGNDNTHAPSVTIEFTFDTESRHIGDLSVRKSRLACREMSYLTLGYRLRSGDEDAKRLGKVAARLNRPSGDRMWFDEDRLTNGEEVVREYMKAANRLIAKEMHDRDLPWLFRNHGGETRLSQALSAEQLELIKALSIALYETTPNGHADLGLDKYCHFTSPLRRFADLVNHLTLHANLEGLKLPYTERELAEIADELTRRRLKQGSTNNHHRIAKRIKTIA